MSQDVAISAGSEVEVPSLIVPPHGERVAGLRPAQAQQALASVLNRDEFGRTPTVLVVDAVEINRRLVKAMLRASPYRVLEARHCPEALAILDREAVDLLIVDYMMPEMSGMEFCRLVKSSRRTQLIPVLMLSSVQGAESEIAGISSGADEFLTKPLHPEVLRTRVRAMLRNKAAIDSLEEAETILFALAQAVEKRDKYTGDHCERLARYSVALGQAVGLPRWQLVALYRGGYLHDIGKVGTPDAVLFKKGALNEEEWVIMRDHTTRGEEICRPLKTLATVLPIIRNHHERWDGTGYPDGLGGEEIPLLARILQMADIFDALTTERPYKPAYSVEEALRMMDNEVKRGWRDPELFYLFQQCCQTPLMSSAEEIALLGSLTSFRQSLDNMERELRR